MHRSTVIRISFSPIAAIASPLTEISRVLVESLRMRVGGRVEEGRGVDKREVWIVSSYPEARTSKHGLVILIALASSLPFQISSRAIFVIPALFHSLNVPRFSDDQHLSKNITNLLLDRSSRNLAAHPGLRDDAVFS